MSVFVAIAPCRLVDTRNLFNPAIITPGATPFAAGETRTYRTQGNCGLPLGTNRIFAVSLAITTLPAPPSGDIETVPHGATLGGTVDMVVQANQWNSVSKVVRVDANGDFDTQVRITVRPPRDRHQRLLRRRIQRTARRLLQRRGNYSVDGGLASSVENTSLDRGGHPRIQLRPGARRHVGAGQQRHRHRWPGRSASATPATTRALLRTSIRSTRGISAPTRATRGSTRRTSRARMRPPDRSCSSRRRRTAAPTRRRRSFFAPSSRPTSATPRPGPGTSSPTAHSRWARRTTCW